MMKKIYGVIIITVLLFTVSCKQDPPILPSNLQNATLLGKWYLTTLVIVTQTGNADAVTSDPIENFTDKDYFEFGADNKATFSSTIYNKQYQGYYSANSSATPATLSFKSGELYLKYYVDSIDVLEFTVYETRTTTVAGVTTQSTYYYTYKR